MSSLDDGVCGLLRDAFEDAPFEFWARDLTGRCVVANAATRALNGVADNKVEEASVPPEVIAAWQENNRRAYAGEFVQNSFEYGEGAERRYLKCYIVPLRLNGKINGILGFNIDITERRRVEDELREVDRRRSEFLGVLSHELRNPLAVIGSAVHCIDHAALYDEQVRRALAVIDRQSRHLSRLVDDLLDITRVRSGKIDLQRTDVDLVQLVRTTVEDHREQLAQRSVTVNIDDEVRAYTHGDATRLAQIVSNLLSNAAKFTPAGGAVTVSLSTCDGRAVLEVSDTGVGIDEASLRGLFVPFVQADRTFERSRQGLGLGLALTKTLVEMHGGDVRAHSRGPGEGATFTVTLPLTAHAPRAAPPLPRTDSSPRNVLIIEDDEDAAEWLSIALSFHGHRLTIALDGATGIAKARELAPDVVLCDIGLPGGVDGYAVARTLRQELASTYRVALSGFTQPEDQDRARAAGFDAHVSKPPDVNVLARMLAELPKR